MSTISPPKPPQPPPPRPAPKQVGPAAAPTAARSLSVSKGRHIAPQRIVIVGTSGIGKSELAANISQVGIEPLFLDLEHGSNHLEVARISDIGTYEEFRGAMQSEELLKDFGALVIDSGTEAQELCESWVVVNKKTDKNQSVQSLGEFNWGKGQEHTYDAFLNLMGDFDAQIRRGRHVVVICHQCTELVPNANGEDYLQYQPRLQLPKSGKNSIRHRLVEWADHLFFIGYDKIVTEDGKARGSGTRAIYTAETPDCLAKSRTLPGNQIIYEKGSAELWRQLFNTERSV